ncbi:hypothetical protein [Hymenobacter glacialis]|uniref:hypothetical protein n=1 Tax=Hymenobacter glacialis TaxID=1908236 RepID=UPI0013018315|nr:hypothetical protein [Hymenobacter glacialis]
MDIFFMGGGGFVFTSVGLESYQAGQSADGYRRGVDGNGIVAGSSQQNELERKRQLVKQAE